MNFIKKYYVGILHFAIVMLVSAVIVLGVQLKNNATTINTHKVTHKVEHKVATRCPSKKRLTQRQYIDKTIYKYSKKYDVDPKLIHSIIKVESNYNPNAVSKTGDMGLMQINKCHKVKNVMNIDTNVEFGTRMVSGLIKENKGNTRKALYCYNTGSTNVKRHRIPKSTKKYANKILALRKEM